MSYKIQEFVFSVPLEDVQVGVPVGWEAEFSLKSSFVPTTYRLTTYEEQTAAPNVFYYSLDNVNFLPFPLGEQGMAFYGPYQMKVLINVSNSSFLYAEKYGKIYRISGDGKNLIDSYAVGYFNSSSFNIDRQNNLYVSGQNKTLYKIDTSQNLIAGDNSVDLHSNPLSVDIDGIRNSFWQVDRTKISLKDLNGHLVFETNLPFDIDTDYSSSSSSSSTEVRSSSSSSSSSTEIRSSSSSESSNP